MINIIKEQMKGYVVTHYRGQKTYDMLANLYDGYSSILWQKDKRFRKSENKIIKLRNKYSGKRCFIIGNGPSLNKTNLKLLKDEYTFGLNRAYMLFERTGFATNFLVSINSLVLAQCGKEISDTPCLKFVSWKGKDSTRWGKDVIFLRSLVKQQFSKDIAHGIWEGATVTYAAMQIAYYMGFSKVILIGVDHNFKTSGPAHKAIISQGADKNHFDPNYFGKGFKWNLPDLVTSEYAYGLAKEAFEKDGREIVDATVGGKLKIFKKEEYKSLTK